MGLETPAGDSVTENREMMMRYQWDTCCAGMQKVPETVKSSRGATHSRSEHPDPNFFLPVEIDLQSYYFIFARALV